MTTTHIDLNGIHEQIRANLPWIAELIGNGSALGQGNAPFDFPVEVSIHLNIPDRRHCGAPHQDGSVIVHEPDQDRTTMFHWTRIAIFTHISFIEMVQGQKIVYRWACPDEGCVTVAEWVRSVKYR